MELQLGLSLSTSTFYNAFDDDFASTKRKRTSADVSESHWSETSSKIVAERDDQIIMEPRTLPLFLWSNQPNDEEDDEPCRDSNCNSYSSINQIDEEDDSIVGWPPIKFRQRKMRQNPKVGNGCAECHGKVSNSMYVKVKMEGVAIARKIDLSNFNSFQDLKQILIGMFGIFEENSTSYKLTYQDREGDWLLAEDVSWRSFIGSVQRLKLMRSSNC